MKTQNKFIKMSLHIQLYSALYKFFTFIFYRRWLEGVLYKCRIKNLVGNSATMSGKFYNSTIIFKGTSNVVESKGDIFDCNMLIVGYNNKIVIGENCIIRCKEITVRGNDTNIIIGDRCQFMGGSHFVCQGNGNFIHIGSDCLFSTDVQIWNSDTHTIYDKYGNVANPSKPITIGDHVWLGQNVSVLKGVTIGDCSIIGMASVVSKSIEEHSIAVGNPARKVNICHNWDNKHVETVAKVKDE